MATAFAHTLRALRPAPFRWVPRLTLALGLLAWLGWMGFGRVSIQAVSLHAQLEADGGAFPVVAAMAGHVVHTALSLDAQVTPSTALVELDTRLLAIEAQSLTDRLTHQEGQDRALAAERSAQRQAFVYAEYAAATAIEEAQTALQAAQADQAAAEAEHARIQQLHIKGHVPDATWETVQAQVQQKRLATEAHRHAIAKLDAQRTQLVHSNEIAMASLAQQRHLLRQERTTAAAQLEHVRGTEALLHITAPVHGRLSHVEPIRVGSRIEAGDTLGIVVQDRGLVAVAFFEPGEAMGRIAPGQTARLKLDGFPWTQHGPVTGTVRAVADAALRNRVRVEVAIDSHQTSTAVIAHGLPGTLEITVEQPPPFQLVLRLIGHHLHAFTRA
ncbi:MAG: hypothetical protein RhofKO_24550 [Rhodothermales bacterium]